MYILNFDLSVKSKQAVWSKSTEFSKNPIHQKLFAPGRIFLDKVY